MGLMIFSDLHLNEWNYGASLTEDGYNSRLINQKEVVFELLDLCEENYIKEVLFCGDLFHTQNKISTKVLKIAWDCFSEFNRRNIKAHIMVGNHDMADKSGKIHSLDWLKSIAHVIDKEEIFEVDGLRVAALPYTEDNETLQVFLNKNAYTDLMMLHQGVSGVPLGSGMVLNEFLNQNSIPTSVKHAFTGHYHIHKRVAPNLTIVGSTTQQNWLDADSPRGFVLYNASDNIVKHIPSKKAFRFKKLDNTIIDEDIKNCFIRFETEIPQERIQDIRQQCLDLGALSVEFKIQDKNDSKELKILDISLDKFIENFERTLDKELIKTGRQIREGKYEITEV